MNNTQKLLMVHIKSQKILYLIPLLFVYLFFLPYQHQILQIDKVDDMTMIKIYDSAQMFLLLFAVWYQFLGFRIGLYHELREISCGVYGKRRWVWCICCLSVYLITLLPYFVWLCFQCFGYQKVIGILIFQMGVISAVSFFVMQMLRSALAGMAVIISYLFASVFHLLPGVVSIVRLGLLPQYFSKEWYIVQGVSLFVCLFSKMENESAERTSKY